MDLTGKRVCVCGIARSGIWAAQLAKKAGSAVVVTDLKSEDRLEAELKILNDADIEAICGRNPDESLLDKTDLVIISPGIPYDLPFIEAAKNKNVPVLPEIEFASKFCKAKIAAITGTNGKTTTTALVGEIMKKINRKSMALGNIGTAFSAYCDDIPEDAYAVLEMSSFQLEAVSDFKPNVAAVIQITPDHLDRHKTMENYISIKARVFENQDENDFAVLNHDDEACFKMAQNIRSRVIFFSQKTKLLNGIYLDGTEIVSAIEGTVNQITDTRRLMIPGSHNVENVMAAIGISIALGVPADIIRETVESFKGVPHRIEFVRDINGVKFYNDSKATNPDSAIKGLMAMNGSVVLIGGGYDKNAGFAEWVRLFDGKVRRLIVMGQTADKITETCKAHNFSNFDKVNSLKDAVSVAFAKAQEGDSILLSPACASWDMFDDFEQRGDMFRSFVNEL